MILTAMGNIYLEHYKPLIKKFIEEMDKLELPEIQGMPEPFLSYFGKRYFSSRQRIVFVGQDTKNYGDLRLFIKAEKNNPLSKVKAELNSFQKLDFKDWRATRYSFFGFIMMFFAIKNGLQPENWTFIKQDKYKDILESFAWANCQPIEYYNSTAKHRGVDSNLWEKVRNAGRVFYGFKHILTTLDPNVVVILHKNIPFDYFEGVNLQKIEGNSFYEHYILNNKNVHIIKLCHPNRMRWTASEMTASNFCNFLKDKMDVIKKDSVISANTSAKVEYFKKYKENLAKTADKYEFIFALAKYLQSHNIYMSYNGLAELLNYCGYTTNRGTQYIVNSKRARIIGTAYRRAKDKNDHSLAETIATVFVNPNFSYKYE